MKSNILRIGIGQIELTDDWDKNVESAISFYRTFSQEHCQFSVFPELWPSAFGLKDAANFAKLNREKLLPQIRELTAKNQFYSHWGSMLHEDRGNYYNRAIILNPAGETALTYDKIHLFGTMKEDQFLSPGGDLPMIETPWGKVATAICYDLRFPELFRYYALNGVKIVFLPAEWPHPRLNHWRQLIQARAIENQIFMVACNRTGKTGKYDFFGHSMIVDPWGQIVFEADESETAAIVNVDLSAFEEVKRKLNTIQDINFTIFQKNHEMGK